MFGRLHEAETDDKLKQEILLVSEPILRSQLLKIYNELTGGEERRQIATLRQELEALKSEIRLLKDDKH